jgi:flavin reductase (DIM6/NTAB) family NADH-FMN oxidoreductase RutF
MIIEDIQHGFRGAMRRLASTVSLVSCSDGGENYGITVTAVTSVCAEPAAVLVCVNKSASIHDPLVAKGHFYLNLLCSNQVALSEAFSGKMKGAERFSIGIWKTGRNGQPFLEDAQANLFCLIDSVVHYGSHSVVIARVKEVRLAEGIAPLIYQDGRYAGTAPLPELTA